AVRRPPSCGLLPPAITRQGDAIAWRQGCPMPAPSARTGDRAAGHERENPAQSERRPLQAGVRCPRDPNVEGRSGRALELFYGRPGLRDGGGGAGRWTPERGGKARTAGAVATPVNPAARPYTLGVAPIAPFPPTP